jgi:hypothetical protein
MESIRIGEVDSKWILRKHGVFANTPNRRS